MAQPSGRSAWIVLPCILFSLFAARFLIEDFASPDERGLFILAKAVLIFFTTLVLTTKAANSLFQTASPPTQPPTRNVLRKKRKISLVTEERAYSWRENTAPNLCWSSDSSNEVKKGVKQRRKKKQQKISRKKRESDAEKLLRKRLLDVFKPKRYQLLGVRRETVEELVREDPLL